MATLHEHWQSTGADFAAGVALLAQHGPDLVTKNILTRLKMLAYTGEQPSAYETGKLAYALGKIGSIDSIQPIQPIQSNQSKQSNQSVKSSDTAKALHKAHSHHHALMVTAETDAERAEHATKIMEEIIPALDEEYDRLKAGGPSNSSDDLKGEPKKSEADKLRRLQSLRTRIGQLKKKLLNPKDLKTKQKYETELAEKTAEKERLEAELS